MSHSETFANKSSHNTMNMTAQLHFLYQKGTMTMTELWISIGLFLIILILMLKANLYGFSEKSQNISCILDFYCICLISGCLRQHFLWGVLLLILSWWFLSCTCLLEGLVLIILRISIKLDSLQQVRLTL